MRAGSLTGNSRRSTGSVRFAPMVLVAFLCLPTGDVAVADGDLAIPRLVALQQEPSSDKAPKKGSDKSTDKSPRKNAGKSQGKSSDAAKPRIVPAGKTGEPATGNTKDREIAVEKFVEQHHSELAAVLNHLKDNNSQEYDRAIRDLSRVVERLSQTRSRDSQRYELELKQWQNQSRIDLLTARLKMANSEDYRDPMRVLLRERIDLKVALLQFERERLVERLQKSEQLLQALGAEQDAMVESQLRVIIGTNKPAKPVKPAGAAKKNSSK